MQGTGVCVVCSMQRSCIIVLTSVFLQTAGGETGSVAENVGAERQRTRGTGLQVAGTFVVNIMSCDTLVLT